MRERCKADASAEEVLFLLREEGYSRAASIEAVMELENVSLAEAKRIVHGSDTWSDVREDADELHDALLDALKNEHQRS